MRERRARGDGSGGLGCFRPPDGLRLPMSDAASRDQVWSRSVRGLLQQLRLALLRESGSPLQVAGAVPIPLERIPNRRFDRAESQPRLDRAGAVDAHGAALLWVL